MENFDGYHNVTAGKTDKSIHALQRLMLYTITAQDANGRRLDFHSSVSEFDSRLGHQLVIIRSKHKSSLMTLKTWAVTKCTLDYLCMADRLCRYNSSTAPGREGWCYKLCMPVHKYSQHDSFILQWRNW